MTCRQLSCRLKTFPVLRTLRVVGDHQSLGKWVTSAGIELETQQERFERRDSKRGLEFLSPRDVFRVNFWKPVSLVWLPQGVENNYRVGEFLETRLWLLPKRGGNHLNLRVLGPNSKVTTSHWAPFWEAEPSP